MNKIGLGGLLHLLPLGFTELLFVYALWGVSTIVWMFYIKKVELHACGMNSDIMNDLKCKTCK